MAKVSHQHRLELPPDFWWNLYRRGVFDINATTPSSASLSNSHTTSWEVENLLTFDRTFAVKHQVNVVALYSAEQTSTAVHTLRQRIFQLMLSNSTIWEG